MILPAKSRVWSDRFRDLYDTPNDRSSLQLKIEYQIRRIVLWQKINFSNGEHEAQTLWLEVMRSMLLESLFLLTRNKQTTSKTFEVLREVLFDSDFLNRPVSGYGQKEPSTPSNLFCAVQLVIQVSERLVAVLTLYSASLIWHWIRRCVSDAAEPTTTLEPSILTKPGISRDNL